MMGFKKSIDYWNVKLNQISPSLVTRLPVWLGHFSIVLWASSLLFPALVTYSGDSVSGAAILMMGWLAAFGLNFAWFANIFLLYVYVKLHSSRKPIVAVSITVLLALMTFLFNEVPLNEGGATSPVMGYGMGAMLWFLSIWVMTIAVVVTPPNTISQRKNENAPLKLLAGAVIGIALPIVCVALIAQYGRYVANPAERVRLQSVVIKRGSVCSEEVLLASDPITHLEGPLEIRIQGAYSDGQYPFGDAKRLLGWGIPTLRMGSTDFSYEFVDDNALITSVDGSGPPAVVIDVTTLRNTSASDEENRTRRGADSGSDIGINIRMVETSSDRVVFDQDWRYDTGPGRRFKCPDYSSFPGVNQEPRRVVMHALGLSGEQLYDETSQILDREGGWIQRVTLNVTERRLGGITREMKNARWKESNGVGFPPRWYYFENCPDNIVQSADRETVLQFSGLDLKREGKSYYLDKSPRESKVVCDDSHSYTYVGTQNRDGYEISIRQRRLHDFRINWTANLLLENSGEELGDNALGVLRMSYEDGELMVETTKPVEELRDNALSISRLGYEEGKLLVEITNPVNGRVVLTEAQVDLPAKIE